MQVSFSNCQQQHRDYFSSVDFPAAQQPSSISKSIIDYNIAFTIQ
jgi:hypothetical protein